MKKTILAISILSAASFSYASQMARVVFVEPINKRVVLVEFVCPIDYQPYYKHRHNRYQLQNCYERKKYENQIVGYNVSYIINGREYSTKTSSHPGSYIRIDNYRSHRNDRHNSYRYNVPNSLDYNTEYDFPNYIVNPNYRR